VITGEPKLTIAIKASRPKGAINPQSHRKLSARLQLEPRLLRLQSKRNHTNNTYADKKYDSPHID
jgi:hypothetical protein